MAKDLVLDVVARKNSKDLEALALEFDKLAASVDNSNKSSQQSVKFSKFLDSQIAETRKQVQQLAQEFEKTGSADVFGQLRGAERNLNSLTRIRKQVVQFTQAGSEAKSEITGLDAELQRLSTDFFTLTQDRLAPAQAEFAKLSDRQKTQAETVKILEQRYRDTGKALDGLDLRRARTDLERLDEEVRTSADSLVNLGRAGTRGFGGLVKEVENLGRSLVGLKESAPKPKDLSFGDFVRNEALKARTEVDRLKGDLTRGGGVNIFGDLKKAENDLAGLEKIGKEVGIDLAKSVGDGIATGGKEGAKTAASGLQGAFSSPVLGPILAGSIAGAVAVALPTALSLVGAAVIGAGGLGVIGLGIASQIKSAAVLNAFAELKHVAVTGLQEAGSAFTPVLVGGIKEAESALVGILPEIQQNLNKLALPASHLFEGITVFIRALGPGIDAISSAAVPFINVLAEELPQFGHALSQMLKDISAGAPGAILAFHDLFMVLDVTLVGLGKFIEVGEKTFAVLSIFAAARSGDFGKLAGDLAALQGQQAAAAGSSDSMSEALKKLGINLGGVGGAAKDTTKSLANMSATIDGLIGKQLAFDLANDKFAADLLGLKDQLDKNSRSIDTNSLAGLHNRDVLIGMIGDAEQARQAAIDHAGGVNASKEAVDKANVAYQTAIDKLVGVASNAGISRDALNKLAGDYQINVLLAIDAVLKSGLAQSAGHPHDVNRYGSAGPPKRAGGGSVMAGMPYVVGENGPELFLSDQSGMIIPNGVPRGLGAPPPGFRATSAAGAQSGVTITFAGNTDGAFVTAFMGLVRTGQIQVA